MPALCHATYSKSYVKKVLVEHTHIHTEFLFTYRNLRISPALAVHRLFGGCPVVEGAVGACLSVDPRFARCLVG